MRAYIITGCSRGLGLAITQNLLARGARVIGIARQAPTKLTQAPATLFSFIRADLSQSGELDQLMTRALALVSDQPREQLCLINNAGVVTPIAQAGHYSAHEVEHALAINLIAPIMLCNALLQQAHPSNGELRLLNISSGAAQSVYSGWGVYGASKAGLDHFSRHVALEQTTSSHPARIAALYPGVVDTEMQASIRASSPADFPLKPRFDALERDGELSSPAAAAEAILNYLHDSAFGTQPVVDIRTLALSPTL